MFSNAIGLFQYRNFRTYFVGTSMSMIGSWMQKIAIGWLAWSLTESAFWLGILACADLIPTVLLSPAAGVLADRRDPKTVMIVAQSVALIQALIIAVLFYAGVLGVELLILMTLIHGIAMGINQPARLVVVGRLVPSAHLPTCIAVNAVAFNLSRFIGPAVAGFLIAAGNMGIVFILNALSFLVFALALSGLRIDRQQTIIDQAGVLRGTLEAMRFVIAHKGLFPVLTLMTVSCLASRPLVELLPSIVELAYGGGAEGLALLSSSIGLGAVLSGAWLSSNAKQAPLLAIVVSCFAMAVCATLMVLTGNEVAGAAFAFVTGAGMLASSASTQILMQQNTPDKLKGRVLSFYALIIIGGPAIGALFLGLASDFFGLQATFILASLLVIVAALRTWSLRATLAQALQQET